MKINPSTEITSIKLIDIKNNKEFSLFEIKGSRCHFLEKFIYENYFIQLRLDWSKLDKHRDPTLDADIWFMPNGKKIFLKKDTWHNTKKQKDPETNRWIYVFEFKDLKLYLGTKQTAKIAKSLTYCVK